MSAPRSRAEDRSTPRTVSLPGFVIHEPIGLGDVIKRTTTLIGMRPCGACAERARRLNSRVVLVGRKP